MYGWPGRAHDPACSAPRCAGETVSCHELSPGPKHERRAGPELGRWPELPHRLPGSRPRPQAGVQPAPRLASDSLPRAAVEVQERLTWGGETPPPPTAGKTQATAAFGERSIVGLKSGGCAVQSPSFAKYFCTTPSPPYLPQNPWNTLSGEGVRAPCAPRQVFEQLLLEMVQKWLKPLQIPSLGGGCWGKS